MVNLSYKIYYKEVFLIAQKLNLPYHLGKKKHILNVNCPLKSQLFQYDDVIEEG